MTNGSKVGGSDKQWARARKIIHARRLHLGLSRTRLAQKSELSPEKIKVLETTQTGRILGKTAKRLCKGLRWTPESLATVLHGGNPTLLPDEPDEPPVESDLLGQLAERFNEPVLRKLAQIEDLLADTRGEHI